MRAFLYARVSTADKEQDPEVQLREMREFSQRRGWTPTEFSDKMSGTKSQRPQFQEMLRQVRQRKCDVVVVYRFSRFARSTRDLLNWLEEFKSLGVQFVSLHEAIDTSTPIGALLFKIIAAIAEFEVDIIRENVRAGLAHARSKGQSLGRPRRIADSLKITTMRESGRQWDAIATECAISVSTAKRIARSATQGRS